MLQGTHGVVRIGKLTGGIVLPLLGNAHLLCMLLDEQSHLLGGLEKHDLHLMHLVCGRTAKGRVDARCIRWVCRRVML